MGSIPVFRTQWKLTQTGNLDPLGKRCEPKGLGFDFSGFR